MKCQIYNFTKLELAFSNTVRNIFYPIISNIVLSFKLIPRQVTLLVFSKFMILKSSLRILILRKNVRVRFK